MQSKGIYTQTLHVVIDTISMYYVSLFVHTFGMYVLYMYRRICIMYNDVYVKFTCFVLCMHACMLCMFLCINVCMNATNCVIIGFTTCLN